MAAAIAFHLWGGGAGCMSAQTLTVAPDHILLDELATIRATELRPGEHVTIEAELTDGEGQKWASEAEFVADTAGTVDVSQQAPVAGSYKREVAAMGLIWSMSPRDKHVAAYEAPSDLSAQSIELRLALNGQTVSTARLSQTPLSDDIHRVTVHGELHGILFLPGSNEPHPGVLVLGGSEGGIPLRKAAWLASRGYAAFALAYFRYENLPSNLESIPLEYFGQALEWMIERSDIMPGGIAVVGTSRGAELALQLGSMFPQVRTVVAYSPANSLHPACCGGALSVPYAWTWRGRPLYFSPRGARPGTEAMTKAAIHVERIRGPILLISGDKDGVWPSTKMADAVVERLKQAKFPYTFVHLKYHDAGHRVGRPGIEPAWQYKVRNPVTGKVVDVGGTVSGNAHSSLDAMPRVLEFLHQAFLSNSPVSKR